VSARQKRPPRRDEAVRDLKLNLRHFVVELLVSSYEATEDVGVNPTDLGALCLLLLHGPAPAGRLAYRTIGGFAGFARLCSALQRPVKRPRQDSNLRPTA
jgi:hypothetical protein